MPDLLRSALAACRRALIFAAIFSLLINLALLSLPLYMMQVYDRVLSAQSVPTLVYLTLIALGALLTLGLLEMARSRLLVRISEYIEESMAPAAFERSLANSLRGRSYRSEALRDVRELRNFLSGPGILALFDLPWTPLFLLAIYTFHPTLGLFAATAVAVLLVIALVNDLLSRPKQRRAGEIGGRVMRELDAFNRNAEIIDALGMEEAVRRRWLARNREALTQQTRASAISGSLLGFSKFCRYAVQVLIIATGAWLVLQQEVTGGAMMAGSILLGRALMPIDQAIGTWKYLVGARAAYRRLRECFAEPPLRPQGMPLPRPRGGLALEGVAFEVGSRGRMILRDVSFALEPGETLAIVGPSAAGKSTLARLLVGTAAPDSGHVRLDGADLFPWSREQLGRHIGYLPQDVSLFAGTVAENIARLGEADASEVIAAAERANVHEMILRLPSGYDTEIGEGGHRLSGGQRQRIALARALFGEPSLVVLDEPNANLDSEGDAALTRALAELKALGTTVVLITHRPGLVTYADKLLVLAEGAVEMFGPRQEIMAQLRPRGVPQEAVPLGGGQRYAALRRAAR